MFMMKNLILLAVLAWVTSSYAKDTVVRESLKDGDSFKVEKASGEQEVKREVAGGKFKKKVLKDEATDSESEGSDSEVRYWQYSE